MVTASRPNPPYKNECVIESDLELLRVTEIPRGKHGQAENQFSCFWASSMSNLSCMRPIGSGRHRAHDQDYTRSSAAASAFSERQVQNAENAVAPSCE